MLIVTDADLEVLEVSGNALVNAAYEANLDTTERDGRTKKKYGYEAYFFEKYMNQRYFIDGVYQQLVQQAEKDHVEQNSNEALQSYNLKKDRDGGPSSKSSRDKRTLERTKSREDRERRRSERSREDKDKRRVKRTSSKDDTDKRHLERKDSREDKDRRRSEKSSSKENRDKKETSRESKALEMASPRKSAGRQERKDLELSTSRESLGNRGDKEHRKSRSTSRHRSSSSRYDDYEEADGRSASKSSSRRGSRPRRNPSESSIAVSNDNAPDDEKEVSRRRGTRSDSSRSLSKAGHSAYPRSPSDSTIDDLLAESSCEEGGANQSHDRSSSGLYHSKEDETGKERRGKLQKKRSMSQVPTPGTARASSGANLKKMASKTNSTRTLERSNSKTGSSPDLKGSRSREGSLRDLKRANSEGELKGSISREGSSGNLTRASSRENVLRNAKRSGSKTDHGRQGVSRTSSRNFDLERASSKKDVKDRRAAGLSRNPSVSGSRRHLLVSSDSSRSLKSLSNRPAASMIGYEPTTTTQSRRAPPQRDLIRRGSVGNMLGSPPPRSRGLARRGSVGNLVQDRQKAQLASVNLRPDRGMVRRGSVGNRMQVQGMQTAQLAARTPSSSNLLQDFPGVPSVQDLGYAEDFPCVAGVAQDFSGVSLKKEPEKSSANTSVTGSVSPSSVEAEVSDYWGAMFQSAQEREADEKRKNEARRRASLAAS